MYCYLAICYPIWSQGQMSMNGVVRIIWSKENGGILLFILSHLNSNTMWIALFCQPVPTVDSNSRMTLNRSQMNWHCKLWPLTGPFTAEEKFQKVRSTKLTLYQREISDALNMNGLVPYSPILIFFLCSGLCVEAILCNCYCVVLWWSKTFKVKVLKVCQKQLQPITAKRWSAHSWCS